MVPNKSRKINPALGIKLVFDPVSGTQIRTSARPKGNKYVNGMEPSVCRLFETGDIVRRAGRNFRVLHNCLTNMGVYCVLCDDSGIFAFSGGVQFTEEVSMQCDVLL